MAKRTRVVLELGGKFFAGARLAKQLPSYLPTGTKIPATLTGWRRIKWMVEQLDPKIKHRLWILREPRRLAYDRSRYVKFCREVAGIGKDLRKKKKSLSASLEGVLSNASRNPLQRPTVYQAAVPEFTNAQVGGSGPGSPYSVEIRDFPPTVFDDPRIRTVTTPRVTLTQTARDFTTMRQDLNNLLRRDRDPNVD